ncbi:MAG: hydrolase [Actinomycetia bacterium]|nr:hydrolase [Actinomycetes bacterium]
MHVQSAFGQPPMLAQAREITQEEYEHGLQTIDDFGSRTAVRELAYAPGDVLGHIRELALSKTAASDHLVLYHGAHHEDVPSIVATGLRPSDTVSGWTVTDDRDGAAIHAEKKDWTSPRVIELHVPVSHAEDYLGEPSEAAEGTVYALRRRLPAAWVHQVHEIPPAWTREGSAAALGSEGHEDTAFLAKIGGMGDEGGRRFMSVEELGGMESQYILNGRALTMDEAYHDPSVRFSRRSDQIAQKDGYRDSHERHDALRQSIREHGLLNSIFYDPDTREVSAGHHRYFAGRDEGLTQFPVNDHSVREGYQKVEGFDSPRAAGVREPRTAAADARTPEQHRRDDLAAMDANQRATTLAQVDVRREHPATQRMLQEKNGQRNHSMATWLAEAGVPRADESYVAMHQFPGRRTSNTGRGPDGEPCVILHPDRWDYGTMAHETAHIIADHETGRPFAGEHGPDGAHDDRWAGHYARLLNRLSRDAGADFLEKRSRYLDEGSDESRSARARYADPFGQDPGSEQHTAAAAEGPWYHGSPNRFTPGDVIDPAFEQSPDDEPYAYLARDPGHANAYGHVYEVSPSAAVEPVPHGAEGEFRTAGPARVTRKVSDHDPAAAGERQLGRASGWGARHTAAAQNPPCHYCGEPLDDEDVRDGASAHEECQDMRWCEACQEHHDDPATAEEHNETYTDWGGHLPFDGGIHRGITIRLPQHVHNVVHDESRPPAERASALNRHLAQEPLGVHWTDHEPIASAWATGEGATFGPSKDERSSPSWTHVVMHAASPDEEHIETDPDVLTSRNLLGFDHHRSEREIPVRDAAPVTLTGLSWKRADQGEWSRHDFTTGIRHTASSRDEDDEDDDGGWKEENGATDAYVTCDRGHRHWGTAGAAGLLMRHRGDDGQYRYLLQRRSSSGYVDHGGTWSTPGGGLQHGESPEEGAVREAHEEIGELPEGVTHHHTFTDDHGGWAYHTVVMNSPRQFAPHGGTGRNARWEDDGHGWFTPQQVKELPLHPGFASSWGGVRKSGAVTAKGSMPKPDYDPSEDLPEGRGIWYRAHDMRYPLDEAHARSAPLNHGYRPFQKDPAFSVGQRGYSSYASPHELSSYMDEMDWKEGDSWPHRQAIAFHGKQVGVGEDNEPLVVPQANPHCCGRVIHAQMPWDDFEGKLWSGDYADEDSHKYHNPQELWRDKNQDHELSERRLRHIYRHPPEVRSERRHQEKEDRRQQQREAAAEAPQRPDGNTVRMVPPEEYGKYAYPDYPRARTPVTLAKHLRKKYPEYYQALHDDIAANGVQAPVLVRYKGPGGHPFPRPQVMDGHHRAAVAYELGMHMPVGDYDNEADYDASLPSRQSWFRDHGEQKEQGEPPWRRHEAVKGYDLSPGSGMIYLDLPEGTVRQVEGGVDDTPHITLVYLGKGITDKAFTEACRRAKEAAADCPPMEGVLRGVDTFPASDSSDGKVPAFVPAYIPGIGKLRQALEDLSASEHPHFRPHVTLGYYGEDEDLPEPHPTVPVNFTRLHVKRGDDIVSYPLGGIRAEAAVQPKNAASSDFISIKTLGNYESMDFPGKTMNQAHEVIRRRERRNPELRKKMDDLRDSIRESGIQRPLSIDSTGWTNETNQYTPMVGDGHHRFSAAKGMGLEEVPVSEVMPGGDAARQRIISSGMPKPLTDLERYGP